MLNFYINLLMLVMPTWSDIIAKAKCFQYENCIASLHFCRCYAKFNINILRCQNSQAQLRIQNASSMKYVLLVKCFLGNLADFIIDLLISQCQNGPPQWQKTHTLFVGMSLACVIYV